MGSGPGSPVCFQQTAAVEKRADSSRKLLECSPLHTISCPAQPGASQPCPGCPCSLEVEVVGGLGVLSFPLGVHWDQTEKTPLVALEAEEELGFPKADQPSSESQAHRWASSFRYTQSHGCMWTYRNRAQLWVSFISQAL